MDAKVSRLLKQHSTEGAITWADVQKISSLTGISESALENQALRQGIVPARYQRNIGAISIAEQQILSDAKVVVIGCGGIGGAALEELVRAGIGSIVCWDFDIFEEHNLNRQVFSDFGAIGHSKIGAAGEKLRLINPNLRYKGVCSKFTEKEARSILPGCNAVIDALDNVPDRLLLSALCRKMQIPLVHGAVEGWMGQLTTQFPGDEVIEKIYANSRDYARTVSTLVAAPAVVASLQVAEVLKILLGRGGLMRNKIMLINLLDMDIDTIEILNER